MNPGQIALTVILSVFGKTRPAPRTRPMIACFAAQYCGLTVAELQNSQHLTSCGVVRLG